MVNTFALFSLTTTTVVPTASRTEHRLKTNTNKKKSTNVSKHESQIRRGFGGLERKEEKWQCVRDCGACCKLDKGPSFATPDEIFDDPSDIQLYRSLIGPDGWCIHFEKSTRTCSIYPNRPYFCHVEPEIFETLYGIDKKGFNREACSCCRDTIKAIYGVHSKELNNFNDVVTGKSPG
ncbi:putative zinc- or iron-chelating domain containing protein [Dillenia turbinata]|uniref:Zinc- or iron-chelating domain containing protein n=1 Tax=Dillenia turbinata TaxID=194707 RepID=A0AAN8ZNB7_9MAGN